MRYRRDEIYKNTPDNSGETEKFRFSREVSEVFDDMIRRSVPDYEENQLMSAQMVSHFYKEGTVIYDLGCSTGTTPRYLLELMGDRPFHYIGIDNSPDMIEKTSEVVRLADQKRKNSQQPMLEFICGDILERDYKNSSVVIAAYTLQFIDRNKRPGLLKKIYDSLVPGGVLLYSEKVVEEHPEMNHLFISIHHQMKVTHGYSDQEIIRKRDALEEVLVPLSTEENTEMLKGAGFGAVSIYHKWYNFASYIAIKV